jgi:four helix bundle suffix protein
MRFKVSQPRTVEAFVEWVVSERMQGKDSSDEALSPACLAANGILSLLNLVCYLLDRQVQRLASDFENEGGFTEKLYRVRKNRRDKQ